MNKELIDHYKADVEIPDVVWDAEKEAFSKIKLMAQEEREKTATSQLVTEERRKRSFKKWMILALAAVFVFGTVTAGATSEFWYKTIEETFNINDKNKGMIDEKGMLVSLEQQTTQGGITINAEECIYDGTTFYMTFSIDGIDDLENVEEVSFEESYVGINGLRDSLVEYLGIDEETGKVWFAYYCASSDADSGYVYLKFANLMINSVAMYEGEWSFNWKIEPNAAIKEYDMQKISIGDTGAKLQSVVISPISLKYQAEFTSEALENHLHIRFVGCKMADGTIIYPMGVGYGSLDGRNHYVSFKKIMDVNEIQMLIFVNENAYVDETDYIYVELP